MELEANFLSIFLELEVVEYMSRYMVHVCVEGVQVYHLYCMWVYVFNNGVLYEFQKVYFAPTNMRDFGLL